LDVKLTTKIYISNIESPCIILRGRQCDIIVLNVHAPTMDKCDNTKDSFYEELEHVFDQFPEYHLNILLGDFNGKLGMEDTFKLTIQNKSLHKTSVMIMVLD
jgi:hypothetical protein